ncbi:MAG: family 1 glycosylhydrolase [Eubacteriaceae bacterium]|nr:family 1 glycosylhydrolase [Eubacteriaceae bacterium]
MEPFELKKELSLGTGIFTPKNPKGRAAENYEADYTLIKKLGLTHCRLELQWPKIEPVRRIFDTYSLLRYKKAIEYMRYLGISCQVVLFRFDAPEWFNKAGGFESELGEEMYLEYVRKVTESLGETAEEFITFEEPNAYAQKSRYLAQLPPYKMSKTDYIKTMAHITSAHRSAYELIHSLQRGSRSESRVSFTMNMCLFEPAESYSRLQENSAKKKERDQFSLYKALATGRAAYPLKKYIGSAKKGKSFLDFHSIAYGGRKSVGGVENQVKGKVPIDDNFVDFYPEGVLECVRRVKELFPLPVYVAMGVADNGESFRIKYLYELLRNLSLNPNDVERLYFYSFADGDEYGEEKLLKYGLFTEAEETGGRREKKSAAFLEELIAAGALSPKMCEEYKGFFYKTKLTQGITAEKSADLAAEE